MDITTSFSIGQTVWTVVGCKAVSFEINTIIIDKPANVRYGSDIFSTIPENECFVSKEALISKLSSDE